MRQLKPRSTGKTLSTTFAAALSLSLAGGLGSAAFAQNSASPMDRTLSIELRDVRLEAAISALSGTTGLNNVVVEAIPGKSFQLVNVKLVDQPLSRALAAIAASAGGILTQEDGIYYLRPKTENDSAPTAKPAPIPQPNAPVADAVPVGPRRVSSRDTQIQRVRLNYLVPSEFVDSLDNPMFLRMAREDALFQPAKNPGPQPINLNNGQFANPAGAGSPLPSTIEPSPNGVSGAVGASTGRDGDSLSQGQRGGRGGGGGGQNGFQGGPGGPGGAGGVGGQGGNQQRSIRPDGINNIIANDADNSLLVEYDDVEGLNRLREIVRLLDVPPKQVIIKAEFVNVSVSDADSFGIDWRFQPAGNIDVQLPPQSQSGSPSLLLAYASGNAVANLRAALTHNTSNLLQAPIISTTNNRAASINVNTTVSIAQTVVIPVLNGPAVTATQQVPVTASNGLTVLPHINGDNSISLAVQPQLQTVNLRADGGFDATSEALTTYRRIANGETMVLGGFINKQDNLNIQRVPLLSSLPIIGNLFTQRDHSITGSEVLVFITPTIIEDRSQGVVGTSGSSPAPTP